MFTLIRYAHCTKYTSDQLDHYPFSDYESRCVQCKVERDDYDSGPEFIVLFEGTLIGEGDTPEKAYHSAAYGLMDRSRSLL